jgi:hypothetical protein
MYHFAFTAVFAAATVAVSAVPLAKRAVEFFNPTDHGGSWLDVSGSGGEPLNVSAASAILWPISICKHLCKGGHFGSEFSRCAHNKWRPQLCPSNRVVSFQTLRLAIREHFLTIYVGLSSVP